jgi:hypothetical protein
VTNRGAESLQSIFSSFYLIYLKTNYFKGKKEYILNAVNYLIFLLLWECGSFEANYHTITITTASHNNCNYFIEIIIKNKTETIFDELK